MGCPKASYGPAPGMPPEEGPAPGFVDEDVVTALTTGVGRATQTVGLVGTEVTGVLRPEVTGVLRGREIKGPVVAIRLGSHIVVEVVLAAILSLTD